MLDAWFWSLPRFASDRVAQIYLANACGIWSKLFQEESSTTGTGTLDRRFQDLTRRANHRHNDIVTKMLQACAGNGRGLFRIASADTDEGAPGGREAGSYQDNVRIVAECAAIATHLDAKRPNLMIARGVEQPRQHDQHGGGEIHLISPGLPLVIGHAVQRPAGISLKQILRGLD